MAAEYAPGTRLNGGRYRVLYEINRGGTAIVYAAVDTSVGKQVALKVMQPHGSKASVNLVAVKREASSPWIILHDLNDFLHQYSSEQPHRITTCDLYLPAWDLIHLTHLKSSCFIL